MINHTPAPWFIHEEKNGPSTMRMIRGILPEGRKDVAYREPVAHVLSHSPRVSARED